MQTEEVRRAADGLAGEVEIPRAGLGRLLHQGQHVVSGAQGGMAGLELDLARLQHRRHAVEGPRQPTELVGPRLQAGARGKVAAAPGVGGGEQGLRRPADEQLRTQPGGEQGQDGTQADQHDAALRGAVDRRHRRRLGDAHQDQELAAEPRRRRHIADDPGHIVRACHLDRPRQRRGEQRRVPHQRPRLDVARLAEQQVAIAVGDGDRTAERKAAGREIALQPAEVDADDQRPTRVAREIGEGAHHDQQRPAVLASRDEADHAGLEGAGGEPAPAAFGAVQVETGTGADAADPVALLIDGTDHRELGQPGGRLLDQGGAAFRLAQADRRGARQGREKDPATVDHALHLGRGEFRQPLGFGMRCRGALPPERHLVPGLDRHRRQHRQRHQEIESPDQAHRTLGFRAPSAPQSPCGGARWFGMVWVFVPGLQPLRAPAIAAASASSAKSARAGGARMGA